MSQAQSPSNSSDQTTLKATVPVELGGQRLDKVLVELFTDYSRSRLQGWMKQQRVLLNGKPISKGNLKVKALDEIELTPGVLEHMQDLVPEDMDLEIYGEDPEYWVINKPAGLVVHPAPGHWTGTLMNGLLHVDEGLVNVPRAGIVHRLDQDTTGLMVVARTSQTQAKLIKMLQTRIVKRVYLAMVWGRIGHVVTVNKNIGRDPKNRLRMAVVDHGKPAVTHFMPVAHGVLLDIPVSLMVCRLETGRTHQIRVHAQHAGFALVADPLYKLKGAGSHSALRHGQIELPEGDVFARQALHATHLSFPNPADFENRAAGQSLADWERQLSKLEWPEFIAPVPDDFQALGLLAGIDLHGLAVQEAVMAAAAQHKASALAPIGPVDEELDDALDEEEDDGDYDVEVVYQTDD